MHYQRYNILYVPADNVNLIKFNSIGPEILMFRLMEYTLCLDQLYGCSVILLSGLCTPVWHFGTQNGLCKKDTAVKIARRCIKHEYINISSNTIQYINEEKIKLEETEYHKFLS